MTTALPELFRDRYILVVDKPSGLPSQGTRDGADNLYDQLCSENSYVGLHHRLDTPASGALLLSLDRRVNRGLSDAFANHSITRTYRVFVLGDVGEAGVWDNAIDNKEAVTYWEKVAFGGGISLIEATLETGRTHQIRKHASHAGHPVIGDKRYGGAAGRAHTRLALHAWKLEFIHPLSDEKISVTAPIPDDLSRLMRKVGVAE
jgi:RluA family pseudouridine synthase